MSGVVGVSSLHWNIKVVETGTSLKIKCGQKVSTFDP